jgi:hypothetical protein
MRDLQRARKLDPDFQHLSHVHRPAVDSRLQGLSIEKFHDDKRPAVVLSDVVNRADLRMVECRCGASFDTESLERLRILRPLLRQELHGDGPAQPDVFGLVDNTHASRAQLFENAIVRNRLPDHGR